MSLTRTALRLAAVNALLGRTAAQKRVYDSRISDLDPDHFSEHAKPVLIVLTDADEGQQLDLNNGGLPWNRHIDLVIELSMVARTTEEDTGDIFIPDTDAKLEASLDVLEQQVEEALLFSLAQASGLFRRICRVVSVRSQRQVTDDASVKMAARQLTYSCRVTIVQAPPLYRAGQDPLPTGLDVLPEPLRTVAKAVPLDSALGDIVTALAAAYAPQTAPPLKALEMTYDLAPDDPDSGTVPQTINLPQ